MMASESSDIIYVRELRVGAVIGVYEWEQRIKQTICLDLEMAADIRKAAASDAIEDTLNYKAVAERVSGYVEESRFNLIETLAERVCAILLEEFRIPWAKVTVGKPGAAQGSREVGVVIERGNRARKS
jgi:7,8-dihydroneopterin aldolase/epimerase/oxygenase